jgi:hypothetical protein
MVPPERGPKLLRQIAAAAHPDGVERLPPGANQLLHVTNDLLDKLKRPPMSR